MIAAIAPVLFRWRAGAISVSETMACRLLAAAGGITHRQRLGLSVLAGAVLIGFADAILRVVLPPGPRPLLPVLLFAAGSAVVLHGNRLWFGLDGGGARRPDVTVLPLVPVAAIAPSALSETDPRPAIAVLDRSIGELTQFPIFTDILISQMASVVALSDGAAHGIMTSLAQVDSEVTTLMSMVRTSDAGVEVGDIVSGIETKVAACGSLLAHFNARQAEHSRLDAVLRVRLEADSQAVLRIVAGVRRIAQQSTILSFNIAIEAGHLGTKDNGFSFIADQVRRLAQDVDALAGQLASQLGEIMHSVIVDSQALAVDRQVAEGDDIAALRTTLANLDGDFRSLVRHQRDVLAKVATGSEAVATPILAMMGSVQFQDITRQQIEQLTLTVNTVGSRISEIVAMLRNENDETDAPDLSRLLDELFKGYVMDGQRGAHLAARGEAAPEPTGLLIELF